MVDTTKAKAILTDWKGDNYAFGTDVLDKTGEYAKSIGKNALLVMADLGLDWIEDIYKKVTASLETNGVNYTVILGAGPNAPREDVYRIACWISKTCPDSIVAVGGGSTIDAAKFASVISTYSTSQVVEHLGAAQALASTVEPFFGVGNVTKIQDATGISSIPIVAVETAASSGAHLTKYSNITDEPSAVPYINHSATDYTTIALHPFMWNLVEKFTDIFPSLSELSLSTLPDQFEHALDQVDYEGVITGSYTDDGHAIKGMVIDSWKNNSVEFFGYESSHEDSFNHDLRYSPNRNIDISGPFNLDALNDLLNDTYPSIPASFSDPALYRHLITAEFESSYFTDIIED